LRRRVMLVGSLVMVAGHIGRAAAQSVPGGEALLAAAERGDAATIGRVLAGGALVDPIDVQKRTPLLIAVDGDHLEVARTLIAAGANINAQAINLDTPWLLAGALGRTEMLRLMIPKGPDFSVRNRYGGNALIPACERGHVETVRLLLTTKINVDHVNNLGWTCLLEIVILGDGSARFQEVTRMVLGSGANPNLKDGKGVSALAHARAKGQTEVARIIAERGGQ
jgi:uncharacterized protein